MTRLLLGLLVLILSRSAASAQAVPQLHAEFLGDVDAFSPTRAKSIAPNGPISLDPGLLVLRRGMAAVLSGTSVLAPSTQTVTLAGVVLDGVAKDVIEGATVSVLGKTAITGPNGQFTLELPLGPEEL